jgi:Family of unknown function (DUF6516)
MRMAAKRALRKVVDEISPVRCASGQGLIREEVWQDEDGRVVRYNLAFVNHFMMQVDNGRVLGYDNSHGYHHRHFKGTTESFDYVDYIEVFDRFVGEVRELRKEKL